jgi:hypothetical protein
MSTSSRSDVFCTRRMRGDFGGAIDEVTGGMDAAAADCPFTTYTHYPPAICGIVLQFEMEDYF